MVPLLQGVAPVLVGAAIAVPEDDAPSEQVLPTGIGRISAALAKSTISPARGPVENWHIDVSAAPGAAAPPASAAALRESVEDGIKIPIDDAPSEQVLPARSTSCAPRTSCVWPARGPELNRQVNGASGRRPVSATD
jgi:hypothetical protein